MTDDELEDPRYGMPGWEIDPVSGAWKFYGSRRALPRDEYLKLHMRSEDDRRIRGKSEQQLHGSQEAHGRKTPFVKPGGRMKNRLSVNS